MGRDARLRRALEADNRGNRARILVAHGQLLDCLVRDLRIEQHYRDWVAAQELHRRTGPPAWVRTEADADRCMAAIQEAEIADLADVLRAMGVPWRWCAEALIWPYFPTMRHNARHPENPRMVKVTVLAPKGLLLQGQAPPHDGAEIERDVTWWYRHVVKHPPDEILQLTTEYATQANRVTEAHSVVDKGLTRAELLLSSTIRPLDDR